MQLTVSEQYASSLNQAYTMWQQYTLFTCFFFSFRCQVFVCCHSRPQACGGWSFTELSEPPVSLSLMLLSCIHTAAAESAILLVVAVRNWSSRTGRWWLARSISTVWLLRTSAESLTQVSCHSSSKVVRSSDFVLITVVAYRCVGYGSVKNMW